MNTINALTAITSIGSSTSDSGNRQQSQHQAKQGQFLTATVLERKDDNQFYLEILGKKILTTSDSVTLSPGAKLKLEVLATTPTLELKIVSKNPELFYGKTLTLLSKNLDIIELFKSLQSSPSPLFSKLSTPSQDGLQNFLSLQQTQLTSAESGENLKLLLNRLGLNLESVLAGKSGQQSVAHTLKAALLEIRSLMNTGTEIAEATNKLLGTIELYQLSQLRLSNENLLIFPLPLPFLNHGYLLVDKDSKNAESDEPNPPRRFSLHLNLEPMGNIEISFLDTPEGLYIRFCCDSMEKSLFASSHQEELKEMISFANLLSLSFGEDAENPAQGLIQQLIPDGEAILDTTI